MQLGHEELNELIDSIWGTISETSLAPSPAPELGSIPELSASIDLRGALQATILMECSEEAAGFIAGQMFMDDPSNLGRDEILDALGEFVNILGGNLKGIYPTYSELGLPILRERSTLDLERSGVDVVQRTRFQAGAQAFRITLCTTSLDFHHTDSSLASE